MVGISKGKGEISEQRQTRFRKSLQDVMPYQLTSKASKKNGYDIYPTHSLGEGRIFNGYGTLAKWMANYNCIIIDGFSGVLWNDVQACLEEAFIQTKLRVNWVQVSQFLRPANEITELVTPFLGERDSVWGSKTSLRLQDFFQAKGLAAVETAEEYDCTIVIGTGASLTEIDAPVVWLDVPKNEIQYRARAGAITNLGLPEADEPAHMYKQFYFVDWVVLNNYKANILDKIIIQADTQWIGNINWMFARDLDSGLQQLSETVLRVRPWFEPGAWGG